MFKEMLPAQAAADKPFDNTFTTYEDDDNSPDANVKMLSLPPATPIDFEIFFNRYLVADNVEYLLTPELAVLPNACRVEVPLLKMQTELEAPLWEIKLIMA
jgi:hypothetical protein